jgi:phosphoglycolate phosphatase
MVKLVVFDLDGTLVDAYPAIVKSVGYVASFFGAPVPNSAVIRRAVGWGDRNLLRPFLPARSVDEALVLYRRHHAAALTRGSRLLPGALLTLKALKKSGLLLAIASNRPRRFSMIILRHLGIAKYFDLIVCGDQVTFRKPHPQILNTIMRCLGEGAKETLYVGDMYIDIQTGNRAHLRTVGVTTGSSTRAELAAEHPYAIIKSIHGLLKVVEG